MADAKFITIHGTERTYYVNIANIALIEEVVDGGHDRVVFFKGTGGAPMTVETESSFLQMTDEIDSLMHDTAPHY